MTAKHHSPESPQTETRAPLWQPDSSRIQAANLTHFQTHLQQTLGRTPTDYEQLHRWSVEQSEAFWQAIWRFFDVQGDPGHAPVLINDDTREKARWFPQAQLNFAENLLARGADDALALIEHREDGRRRTLTFAELRSQSAQLAGFLRSSGVAAGDCVAGLLPNGAEAVIAMLATTRLGAIWTSCSPDFGIQGVLDRFGQTQPKVLFTVNGYQYAGKCIDCRDKVQAIAAALPALAKLVLIDNAPVIDNAPAGHPLPWPTPNRHTTHWADALAALELPAFNGFVPVGFNQPVYILYSSGTTGVPKCIVHGVGGTLLQHLKELGLHTDLRAGDRIFYYTTCGWMMWNWLASALALGSTLVLYDGSPFHPGPARLWDLIDSESLRVFGASAKFYAACEKADVRPRKTHQLKQLDSLLSTGSPLAHESFDYLYRDVKTDLCVSSISGGTDIISCFALGNPLLPVYRGELQCLGLGMDVAFYDEDGQPLDSGKGELVCRNAFPSAPLGFWQDADGSKYHAAYFERFPGIWAHGDFGEICPHPQTQHTPAQRGVIIHGRADATLNPGGVRIGTAEIYRQVETIEAVLEALAVGQRWKDDERVILFVRLRDGVTLDDALEKRIRQTIRDNTTPRHVPAKIIQVADIPRTMSGKIVELAVRKVIHGEVVKNLDVLANPQALAYFENIAALQSD